MNNAWMLARRMLVWRQDRGRLNWSAILSVTGVAVGTAVLVLSLSILNGFESQVHDSLMKFENDLVLLPNKPNSNPDDIKSILNDHGLESRMYAERKLVIQSDRGYRIVVARIVPDLQEIVERFQDEMQQEMGYVPSHPGILVGSILADRLILFPGDRIKLLAPLDISLANPVPPQLEVAVEGIFQFGVLNFDEAYIYLDFEAAGKLIPKLDSRSGIAVVGNGPEELAQVVSTLANLDDWSVRTWETDHMDLITAMKMEKLGSTAVLLLIILVATFNSTSTMVMSVMEKYRQIGILRSLGASRRFIKMLFIRQGMMIGAVGTGLGVGIGGLIGLGQVKYQFIPGPGGLYTESGLPIELMWADFIFVTIAALALCILSAWYPSRRAAEIEPGQAVNYQK